MKTAKLVGALLIAGTVTACGGGSGGEGPSASSQGGQSSSSVGGNASSTASDAATSSAAASSLSSAEAESSSEAASSVASDSGAPQSSSSSMASSESSASSSANSSSEGNGNPGEVLSCEQANTVRGFAAMGNGTTGGQGGTEVTVTNGADLAAALDNKGSEPLTIYVNGTITPDNSGVSKFEVKDMNDVSIIGVGDNALFDGIGIKIWRANNVIVRNITMRYVRIGDKDHITIDGPSSNIWIDHNTFYNSLDVDKDYYDELVSGKNDIDNITLSYNVLRDSWKTSLWGSSDGDDAHRRVTFWGNHWKNSNSRLPLFRFGEGHVINNFYEGVISTGINSRMGATIRVEGNVFESSHNPIVSFYSDDIGYWDVEDNIFNNVTWEASPDEGIIAGPDVTSTVSYTPAYAYAALPSSEVKAHVMANAGAGVVKDCLDAPISGDGAGGSSSSANSSEGSASSDDGSQSSSTDASSSSSSSSESSSSQSSSQSSSTGTTPPEYSGPISNECIELVTDPSINWRDGALQTDQEIVQCLSQTLGRPVGYGENALGGYDPNGNSTLTVITKSGGTSVEQQLFDAVTSDEHHWVVFDKSDFADESEVAMYRLQCDNASVLSAIGGSEAECLDYHQWCDNNGYSDRSACMQEFFNNRLNDGNLPIRNIVLGSNTTIDGRMSNAYFRFNGFAIGKDSSGQPTQTANSVILTHLSFQGAGHTEDHGLDPDMIRATGASHDIWIHKNTFDTTGDAAFDVKVGAYDITMSFNELRNVKRASLHGSSDSREINAQIRTTMHNNAFVTDDNHYDSLGNTGRRVPLIRRGTSHMFNNVFVNYRKDILSVRVGAKLLWEDNMVVVNQIHQEKDDVSSALSELAANLTRDVDGGNYRADGVYLWFADGACELDASTQTPLTDASGSVGDLALDYSSASQSTISDFRLDAGQDLVDYVSATAGKYGELPFTSPLAGDIYYVLSLGKVPCQ